MYSKHHPLTLQFQGFLNTPSLFGNEGFSGYPAFEVLDVELSENYPDLEVPDKLILGKRIESFFAFYIQHYSSEKILFQNHVINQNRRSIGELDYILQNKITEDISHVELVYKYYLYDPGFEKELDRWIGPNKRDTLVKKLDRLKEHQFPLLFRQETSESLESVTGPVERIQQKICFKANLFVPLEMLEQQFEIFQRSEIQGYWIKQKDFTEVAYGNLHFYSPAKKDWPINPDYCSAWHTFGEILQKITPLLSGQNSPLLWMKKKDGSTVRFFVVWW